MNFRIKLRCNTHFKKPFFYYFYYFFTIVILLFFFLKYSYKIYQKYFPVRFQNFNNNVILKKKIAITGGDFILKDNRILFNEDFSLNKHYLEFQNFEKSNVSIIYVNFIIETNNLSDLMISIVSDDGNSSIWFNLGQIIRIYNLSAKYGKYEILSKTNDWQNQNDIFSLNLKYKLKVYAMFKISGESDKFSLRIQGFNEGKESYIGNEKSYFSISNNKINIVHFGKNIYKFKNL